MHPGYSGPSLSGHSQQRLPSLIYKAINLFRYYYQRIYFSPLTGGHLSNVVTVSWQIGWPHWRETTVHYVFTHETQI